MFILPINQLIILHVIFSANIFHILKLPVVDGKTLFVTTLV